MRMLDAILCDLTRLTNAEVGLSMDGLYGFIWIDEDDVPVTVIADIRVLNNGLGPAQIRKLHLSHDDFEEKVINCWRYKMHENQTDMVWKGTLPIAQEIAQRLELDYVAT